MENNTSINSLTTQDAENISYVFPKSEKIIIPRSELQIQLDNFKKAVISSFSIFDFLAVVSLWSPVFANAFAPLFSMSANEVRAGYIVLATVLTIVILWNKAMFNITGVFRKNKKVSSDSEEMSYTILEQCQPKIEK